MVRWCYRKYLQGLVKFRANKEVLFGADVEVVATIISFANRLHCIEFVANEKR